MLDHIIGCPTPYIMGVHRKTYLARKDEFPTDVVKVRRSECASVEG